jgi:hypothetical protein
LQEKPAERKQLFLHYPILLDMHALIMYYKHTLLNDYFSLLLYLRMAIAGSSAQLFRNSRLAPIINGLKGEDNERFVEI